MPHDWQWWLRVASIVYATCWLCYWLWKRLIVRIVRAPVSYASKSAQAVTTNELVAQARLRLITALLGDAKAADRLIAHEHSRAAGIGVGKLEAVERAIARLTGDRSRTN